MLRVPGLCHLVRRRYKVILALGLAATAAGGWLASRLTVDADLAALLPDSYPSVRALRAMGEEVAWTSQLRVALRSEDFDAAVALADTLSRRLAESPWVASVDWKNDVAFYERHALLFLEPERLDELHGRLRSALDRERQAANPFMVDDLFGDGPAQGTGARSAAPARSAALRAELSELEQEYLSALPDPYYQNDDTTVLVMNVHPAGATSDLAWARGMVAEVRRIVDGASPASFAPDMEVHYGSNVKNRIDEYETIRADILGTAIYGVAGVFLLLALFFRSTLVALLVSLSLFASLTWTFGLTYLIVGQLNTITGFLFVVLFGMGVDYGIHAMARYRESRRAGLNPEGALHRMTCVGGSALLTAAVTTSAAFLALTVLEFRGFTELGIITGVGMLFAVAAMLVLLPALVMAAEETGLLRFPPAERGAGAAEGRPLPRARAILAGSLALTVAAGLLFTRVPFQYDFSDLRIITPEREEYARVVRGVFEAADAPAVVLTASPAEVQEVVEAVRAIMRTDTLTPTVGDVRSVRSLVPADQGARRERIEALRQTVETEVDGRLGPQDQARLDGLKRFLEVDRDFTWEEIPEKDRARFSDVRGEPGNFVLIQPSVPLRDGRNAMAFRDDVGTFEGASGKVYHAASSNILVADMLTMITHEGPLAVLLAAGVVFLILVLTLRSLRGAILVLVPLAVGIVWMGGTMALLGMQLNFFNVVVFPSLVGIGVDDGVHIYHRYREEGPGSLPFVLQRTGMPVLLTTLTSIVGYSGLLFAHHPGLQSIGAVAVLGLTTTLVSAVVVLPALLELFGGAAARARA